jgi:hypothetical protein
MTGASPPTFCLPSRLQMNSTLSRENIVASHDMFVDMFKLIFTSSSNVSTLTLVLLTKDYDRICDE